MITQKFVEKKFFKKYQALTRIMTTSWIMPYGLSLVRKKYFLCTFTENALLLPAGQIKSPIPQT